MESDIRQTIERFQAGDREAFAELVSQFQNLVTSIALAESGDFQRSEDIAQQSFMVAWEKQTELKDPNRFAGWLRGIARNLARNNRRLKANVESRSNLVIDEGNEPAISSLTPMESHSRDEQREMLWSTLQRIPLEYREPMILFYREEQSVRSVADQLGLTVDAVKQRLRRGRAMLKEEIRTLVEDLLIDTRPSPTFSAGVMAALPVANTATQSGFLLGAKAMFVKLFGALGTGALLGAMGGLLGTCGGIYGAWVGTQGSIKHATSEEEKSLYRNIFLFALFISIAYVAALVFAGRSFPGAVIVFSAAFVSLLMGSTYKLNRRVRKLHRIHGRPSNMDFQSFEPQPVSRKQLWTSTGGVMLCSCVWLPGYAIAKGSFGIGVVAATVMGVHAWWLWLRSKDHSAGVTAQTRFSARAILETGIVQSSLLFAAWLVRANVASAPVEGLPAGTPFAALIPLPVVLTALGWLFFRARAQDLEEDLAERNAEDGKI